jgi:purine-binding chemotaxis protein CheW
MQTDVEQPLAADALINLACFEVRDQPYAIDVSNVREIVRVQEITALPKAPDLIEGVVELRGGVLPVVDLGRALGGERCDVGGVQARIVVLECDGLAIGVLVDSATDVLTMNPMGLDEPPALATQAGYDAVRAVIRRPGEKPIMVLSLDHILECVYRSALSGQGE